MNITVKKELIQFIVMILIGLTLNPMNLLAYKFDHLYLSLTLFYGALVMASNMMWSHEIIHYFAYGHFNSYVFFTGILLAGFSFYLLRSQFHVNKDQWLKRMISHHSTALTTSEKIAKNNLDPQLNRLTTDIINQQKTEISLMKKMLKNKTNTN